MFSKGFQKVAVSYANLTPEEISERVSEKYPHQGANYGAAAGGALGAVKKFKGSRSKGALIGVGAGAVAGAAAGHIPKAYSRYKSRRLQREIEEYNLRSTPRRTYQHHGEE